MEYSIDEFGKAISRGDATEYHIEVNHGGYGGQSDDGMLVSVTIKTVKRLGHGANQWEPAAKLYLSLDKVGAEWLANALAQITSRKAVGLRKLF